MPAYDNLQSASFGLTAVNHAVAIGLTTSIIGPLTTVTGLQSAITALGTNINNTREAARINRAIDHARLNGLLTNTNVAAADTVAGLRAIFTTANTALTATHSASLLDG